MTPEGKVKAKVRKWLKERYPNAWVGMPVQMGFGRNNFLDFHVIIPKPVTVYRGVIGKGIESHRVGLPVAIETKAAAGTLTKRQEQTIRELEHAGVMVFVIRDAADIKRAQREIDARLRSPYE